MKKTLCATFLVLFSGAALFADTILTASSYFQQISEFYGTIRDYEANISIVADKSEMEGRVSFKRPNYLRIDFTNPENQVISYNGETLTIYLPGPDAALEQAVTDSEGASSATAPNLATPQGLYLMSRYYYISYETGPEPVPIEGESEEMVVNFILSRKNATEGFRTIKLSVSPGSKLIRKVEAESSTGEMFVFQFSGYVLNSNIPDARFIYAAPSSANSYNNFLFSE